MGEPMSVLFHQALFVPANVEAFDERLEAGDAASWVPGNLEDEASLYLECAVTNWPIAAILDELIAPPWSQECECELPDSLEELSLFVVHAPSVAPAMAAQDEVHKKSRRLARKLVTVLRGAGWGGDEGDVVRAERILRAARAPRECNADDVTEALATAWSQRVEALRHACERGAPLGCLLWH